MRDAITSAPKIRITARIATVPSSIASRNKFGLTQSRRHERTRFCLQSPLTWQDLIQNHAKRGSQAAPPFCRLRFVVRRAGVY